MTASGPVPVLLALALDLAFGDPPDRWHPVAALGALLDRGRRRLARGGPARLLVAGGLLVLGVAGLAAGAGLLAGRLAAALGPPGLLVEALALKSALALRGLRRAALRVAAHLEAGELEAARGAVGRDLVSRPTAALTGPQVASAAVESVAENLTDSLLAPLLFYLAFGLPGALAYRAVNTADAMLGYREGALEHFGKAAARLDDLLNLVPARLAALALVAAAPLAGAGAAGALRTAWTEAGRTSSPNAGWTMAAAAGALGVTLDKPGHYRLGRGRPPGPADVRRGVRLVTAAALVGTVLVAAALLVGPA